MVMWKNDVYDFYRLSLITHTHTHTNAYINTHTNMKNTHTHTPIMRKTRKTKRKYETIDAAQTKVCLDLNAIDCLTNFVYLWRAFC